MTIRPRDDELAALHDRIAKVLAGLTATTTGVEVGWVDRTADIPEALVSVTLPEPPLSSSWDRHLTDAIRTAVRETTAETLPGVVATTRLISDESESE